MTHPHWAASFVHTIDSSNWAEGKSCSWSRAAEEEASVRNLAIVTRTVPYLSPLRPVPGTSTQFTLSMVALAKNTELPYCKRAN